MGGAGICLQDAKMRGGGGGDRSNRGFNPAGWIGRLKKAGSVLVAGDERLAGVREMSSMLKVSAVVCDL